MTNARIAALHGLSVGPLPARQSPCHSAKSRALVTSGNGFAASAAGFRLRLGGGVSLRLRSSRLSVYAPLFPLADRRPKPVSLFSTSHPALFGIRLQQFACAAKLPNRPATRQCFARRQVPNAQQPNVMRPGQLKGAGNVAQMFKSAGEFYGRPTVELTNRRKRGTLGRFFNH